MQNETQNLSQTQLKIEELRERNEHMDLMIDLAFKDRLYGLLKNRDADPNELAAFLKMNEKREAQKLKAFLANVKDREIELKEKLEERRLALEERKQALNEKKFAHETQDLPDDEQPAAPTPSAPANGVQAQTKPPTSTPVNAPAPTPRNGTSPTRTTATVVT